VASCDGRRKGEMIRKTEVLLEEATLSLNAANQDESNNQLDQVESAILKFINFLIIIFSLL